MHTALAIGFALAAFWAFAANVRGDSREAIFALIIAVSLGLQAVNS